jgi:hypothetical protein
MEAVRTSETSVDNNFTRQYIPEDNSEHHTRRRENLKSHEINHLLRPVPPALLLDDSACRIARDLWWKNQEFPPVGTIPPCFFMLICHLEGVRILET